MRSDYLKAQDRKRAIFSWSMALFFYAALGGAIAARGLFAVDSLGSYSGPIMIRIGTPEGSDETSMSLPLPAAEAASIPEVSAETSVSPPSPEPAAPRPAEAKPAPAAAITPEPQAKAIVPSHEGSVEAVPPAPAGKAAVAGATAGTESNATGPTSPVGSGTVTLKGSESGNSFQTSYEAGSGKIGRSLYVPIYLYMPLPQVVTKAVYDAIPGSKDGLLSSELRKVEFRSLYEAVGDAWKLKTASPLVSRPRIWLMLQDAGYALARAEYRVGRNLKPVLLEFEVSAPEAEGNPVLLSVSVLSSSGYPEIDEAVVFGFRQAAFFNDSSRTVHGQFTYNFEQ